MFSIFLFCLCGFLLFLPWPPVPGHRPDSPPPPPAMKAPGWVQSCWELRLMCTKVTLGPLAQTGSYWEVGHCPEEAGRRRSLEMQRRDKPGSGGPRGGHGRPARAQSQAVPCRAFSHGVLSSGSRLRGGHHSRGAGAPLAKSEVWGRPGQGHSGQSPAWPGSQSFEGPARSSPTPFVSVSSPRRTEASGEPAGRVPLGGVSAGTLPRGAPSCPAGDAGSARDGGGGG